VRVTGRLQVLYYLNYLVKWYELLDTVILVLRKKPVIFLHEYHHAATLFLCWIQLDQHSTVQWVPITINLLVHVVMYYYYTLASLKIHVWWKKYLTQFQIVVSEGEREEAKSALSAEPVPRGPDLQQQRQQQRRCPRVRLERSELSCPSPRPDRFVSFGILSICPSLHRPRERAHPGALVPLFFPPSLPLNSNSSLISLPVCTRRATNRSWGRWGWAS
jgi:hypothetical protein